MWKRKKKQRLLHSDKQLKEIFSQPNFLHAQQVENNGLEKRGQII